MKEIDLGWAAFKAAHTKKSFAKSVVQIIKEVAEQYDIAFCDGQFVFTCSLRRGINCPACAEFDADWKASAGGRATQ
jgi:hypothetical protein